MAWDRPQGNRGSSNRSGGGGGDQQRFPNSGAIFPVRDKRSDNSPDLTGNILIADDVLDYILREAQNGNEVQLDLSAWVRISRNNTSFTSIKINIPWSVRKEEEGNQTFRRPGYTSNRRQEPAREEREEPRGRRFEPRVVEGGNSYRDQSQGATRPLSTQERRRLEDEERTREFAKGDSLPFDDDDDTPWSK